MSTHIWDMIWTECKISLVMISRFNISAAEWICFCRISYCWVKYKMFFYERIMRHMQVKALYLIGSSCSHHANNMMIWHFWSVSLFRKMFLLLYCQVKQSKYGLQIYIRTWFWTSYYKSKGIHVLLSQPHFFRKEVFLFCSWQSVHPKGLDTSQSSSMRPCSKHLFKDLTLCLRALLCWNTEGFSCNCCIKFVFVPKVKSVHIFLSYCLTKYIKVEEINTTKAQIDLAISHCIFLCIYVQYVQVCICVCVHRPLWFLCSSFLSLVLTATGRGRGAIQISWQ